MTLPAETTMLKVTKIRDSEGQPGSITDPMVVEPTVMEILELADQIDAAELGQIDLVRAALARWGRPAPAPVPVSERPWERDGWCDECRRCWWGRAADEYCSTDWHYATWDEVIEFCSDAMPQLSLPAHALPVPEETP